MVLKKTKKKKNKKKLILRTLSTLFYSAGVLSMCTGIVLTGTLDDKSFESVNGSNDNLNKTVSTKDLMTSYNKLSKEAEKKAKEKAAKKALQEAALASSSYSKSEYHSYAYSLVTGSYGWSESDFISLVKLWNRESGWNANSHSGSGAHGIPQALPASKMASEGSDYYTNGKTQIRWGLKYIKGKYGSPNNAWSYFQSHGYY